jgi:hypothetical protein
MLTNQAVISELPDRSAVNTTGATRASHGVAKASNHISPANATVPVTAVQKAIAPNSLDSRACRQVQGGQGNQQQWEGDDVRRAEQLKGRVSRHREEIAAVHDRELADVGHGEQGAGGNRDRPGIRTKRRLGHERTPC